MAEYPIAEPAESIAEPGPEPTDEELVAQARLGNARAYGELWRRHAHAGAAVARRFTSASDADDLVVEAFIQILRTLRNGNGPKFAFRPYLYTTIRNQARRWGKGEQEIPLEQIDSIEDPATIDRDLMMVALEAKFTQEAFRSLPHQWQTVLWYTEVEDLAPAEVAPIMGMTANSVASLAFRAREGLRSAWVQEHVTKNPCAAECGNARTRLGDFARSRLSGREAMRLRSHLDSCEPCSRIAAEAIAVANELTVMTVQRSVRRRQAAS